jgi:LPXTG-motif cell wall-anchored protein
MIPALARGLGALALTTALLAPACAALAATDDAPPTRTEVIGVEIPARTGTPTSTPTPTPTPTTPSTQPGSADSGSGGGSGGASDGLSDTGLDTTWLWPTALAALTALAAGLGLLASRRHRRAR